MPTIYPASLRPGTTISDGSVTTAKLASLAVTTAKIDTGAVTTGKLGADAVTGTKIADDAVDSEHLAAGAIDTEHIADGQVTAAKLASPGGDGNYNLNVASGVLSWNAAGGGGGSPLWTTTAITATEVTLAADPTWTNLLSTSVTPAAAGDIIECHFSARCTARPTSESVSMQFLIGGSSIGLRTWTPVVDDVIAVTISARVRSIHASTGVVTFDIGGVYAEGVTTWRYAAALASLDTSGAIPIVWRAYQASGTDMKWLVEDDSARIQTPTARA